MNKYTFLIEYKVFSTESVMVKSGSIRCKNNANEAEAKRSLETYLRNTVPGANRVMFLRCVNETQEKQDADALTLIRAMVRNRRAKGDRHYSERNAAADLKGAMTKRTTKEVYQQLFGDE